MKYYFLFLLFFFSSCERYVTEIPTFSLSGKYVLTRLQVTSTDQNTQKDSLYLFGTTYINKKLPHPFDTMNINKFYIHLDNSVISLNSKGVSPSGTDVWEFKNIPYFQWGYNRYNWGYLQFELPTFPQMIFKIEDDGIEHLALRGFEMWPESKFGPKQEFSFFFRRVGP